MDRIVKFRAIDLFSDFVYGQSFYIDSENNTGYIANGIDDYHPVKSDTVGQFTGLVDKNGVEIYENDFYREVYSDGSGERICLVEFKKHESLPSFEKFIGFDIDYENLGNIEVIGNIYENENLLK